MLLYDNLLRFGSTQREIAVEVWFLRIAHRPTSASASQKRNELVACQGGLRSLTARHFIAVEGVACPS